MGVKGEGHGNWHQGYKLVGLNLDSFLPVELFNLDPIRYFRDEASCLCLGLVVPLNKSSLLIHLTAGNNKKVSSSYPGTKVEIRHQK